MIQVNGTINSISFILQKNREVRKWPTRLCQGAASRGTCAVLACAVHCPLSIMRLCDCAPPPTTVPAACWYVCWTGAAAALASPCLSFSSAMFTRCVYQNSLWTYSFGYFPASWRIIVLLLLVPIGCNSQVQPWGTPATCAYAMISFGQHENNIILPKHSNLSSYTLRDTWMIFLVSGFHLPKID